MISEMHEIVEVMKNVGISEKCTMCLIALKDNPEGLTSLQIQSLVKLRQPDISVSLSMLKKNGWADAALIRRSGRGRPHYRYTLSKPFDEMIRDIETLERERIGRIEDNLAKLRELSVK